MNIKLKFIPVILIAILTSCQMKSGDQNEDSTSLKGVTQTAEIISMNGKKITDELLKLQQENLISAKDASQLNKRLNEDLDHYLLHQDIDTKGIEQLFLESVKSFENIKINRSVFTVIQSAYHSITSQRMMRDPAKIDMTIQLNTNNMMNQWFENYQTDGDKLTDLITQVQKEKRLALDKDITAAEYDEMINTVNKIKNDSLISKEQLKEMLIAGMRKHANKSNNSNLAILNVYGAIDRIKKLGIEKELSAIYEKKWVKPKEPSYAEMKQQVTSRFTVLLKEEHISQNEFTLLTNTLINDIAYCESAAINDKGKIKEQLLKGLSILKPMALDTEDREAITDWYFMLSQKKGVDIKNELNKWLYDL